MKRLITWLKAWWKPKAPSGAQCPQCLAPLHPIRSQFIKMCGSCSYQEPWDLKPGQKPLITSNRDTRKST